MAADEDAGRPRGLGCSSEARARQDARREVSASTAGAPPRSSLLGVDDGAGFLVDPLPLPLPPPLGTGTDSGLILWYLNMSIAAGLGLEGLGDGATSRAATAMASSEEEPRIGAAIYIHEPSSSSSSSSLSPSSLPFHPDHSRGRAHTPLPVTPPVPRAL